ncbi:hypothetical protein H8E07_02160, partial [bacterium]|nr:hypothetical protein [bacterium]
MDTGAGIDGEDTAPDNPGEGAAGTVTIENMHTSILDADGDGGIDSLDASVSGQISMPGNPGDLSATITATLLDWAGGDLDDAVSRTTTAPGESDYRLGRLPAGTYELAYTAPGYFPVTESITLAAGETVVDHDLTLDRATTVTGSLVTELTPSFIGQAIEVSYELRSPDGTLIESIDSVAWATFNTLYSDFTFYVSESGTYSLTAWADFHQFTDFTFDVIAGEDVSDLAFVIPRAPLLEGTLSFVDGPGHAGVIYLTSAGEDAPMDSLAFEATGGTFGEGGDLPPFYLSNGSYDVLVDALGYQLWTTSFTVPEDNADINLGDIALTAVRADILRLIDETGAEIVSLSATKSIPDSNVYFPEEINLEAVDQTGRRDLFDLDAKLTGLPLTARKLDDRAPNSGGAWFLGSYATDNVDDIITTVDIIDGEARVWLANDAIEVLRVFAGPEVPDPLKQVTPPTARFMVGFNAPRPTTVVLNASQSTLMAHADSSLTVSAQLYDSAGNLSKQEEIVSFVTVTGTAGTGTFSSPTLETNANGYVDATLRADKAGELLIDCSVVVDNQVLEVRLGNVDGEPGPLPITVTPGPTEAWRLSTSSSVSGIDVPVTITAQTVDAKGNETLEADATVQLTAFPITLGAFTDAAPVSNESGRAVTEFNPAGEAGVVTLTASSALYDGDEADLELRGVTVISDPSFDQEPEDNQSFEAVDLTAMVIDNDPNGLMIEIPFASDWAGLQFHLLFETNWDEAGAEANPFDMPVVYGHAHKPDYVLNLKYDQSYGDLRKWNEISPDWRNWWDDVDGEYLTDWAPGVEIQSTWATFESSGIKLSIPWGPFGGRPDSLRCELYVTQVEDGNRSALDSVPSDDTLNLNWDPDNPDDPNTNWPSMTESRTLTNWSPTYSVKTGFPTPPSLGNVAAAPASLEAGALFVFSARVTDAGDGVGDVLADLAAIAGPRLARMYDDGEANHGDNNAGDGVYSLRTTVSLASPGGEQYLHVMAYDGDNLLSSSATDTVNVIPQVDIIVQAGFTEDEIGDDHGPNQSGVEGLFYTYPTNSVFVAGAFDLLGLNIYETVASVGGEPAEMIAFEVSIGDYPDPADPHTADWNPPYGDLNIQKIDIMIDNGPGGATRGL